MEAVRRRAAPAVAEPRHRGRQRVLRIGQRRQGQRGQDLPGRDRRGPGLALGPVGAGRQRHQRQAGLLRLLPRGVRPRSLRGVHRAAGGRRRVDRPAGHAVPVRPPAAPERRDAAQLAGERQGGARHRRRAARRDLLPDPDGLAVGARPRFRALLRPRHPGGRLHRRQRALRRRRALGGADGLLALDDRGGDRRPHRGGEHRPRQRRPRPRGDLSGHRRRLRPQHQELDGDDDRARRPALLHPRVQDRLPERRDHLQPDERRPDRRPALGDRCRLPGARPTRGAARVRPRRAGHGGDRRQGDRGDDAVGPGLLPLRRGRGQRLRRRLRRLLSAEREQLHRSRRAVAAHRRGHGSSVAGAER